MNIKYLKDIQINDIYIFLNEDDSITDTCWRCGSPFIKLISRANKETYSQCYLCLSGISLYYGYYTVQLVKTISI